MGRTNQEDGYRIVFNFAEAQLDQLRAEFEQLENRHEVLIRAAKALEVLMAHRNSHPEELGLVPIIPTKVDQSPMKIELSCRVR